MQSLVPRSSFTLITANDVEVELPNMLSGWRDCDGALTVQRITGGLTNAIFRAEMAGATPSPVLVRIFGAATVISPSQRKHETVLFEELGRAGHAPPMLCSFGNGRVETFIPASPIEPVAMRRTSIMTGVAGALRRLHGFRPSDAPMTPTPGLWAHLEGWADAAGEAEGRGALPVLAHTVAKCRDALAAERARLEDGIGSPIVFCHNDALAGNILEDDEGRVHLVDFEYSDWNFRGFDIANFFCEAMGGEEDGRLRFERYPDLEERRLFCRAYLAEGQAGMPRNEDVDELVEEAGRYAPVSLLFWGFWALVQCAENRSGFSYLNFGETRFEQYFRWAASSETA